MPASILLRRCRPLLLACVLASAGGTLAAPRIAPLTIAIEPARASVRPGDSVILAARARGGEAIRLIIEWSVDEGETGGRVEPFGELANGDVSARYTAPPGANGEYHVTVQLRGFPAVRATSVISVSDEPAATR
jgi:hypothetical protein